MAACRLLADVLAGALVRPDVPSLTPFRPRPEVLDGPLVIPASHAPPSDGKGVIIVRFQEALHGLLTPIAQIAESPIMVPYLALTCSQRVISHATASHTPVEADGVRPVNGETGDTLLRVKT